ncbi:hypothetical protein B0H13DRAFT_1849606 [Mycena leptocephala]|nr:hypothetical protein B0H13DRAFT_1849606 [Mycena leptocephala]
MSARMCEYSPPPRTVGDDIESFLLVLVWVAVAYAPSKMTPRQRAGTLKAFDDPASVRKKTMLLAGAGFVQQFDLNSPHFRKLDAKVVLEEKKAALETHHWIIQTLRNALQDNEWKDFCDPGAPQGRSA